MNIKLRSRVRLIDLRPEMAIAFQIIAQVYRDHGADACVITSANDSQHMEGSLHYRGSALDIRRWTIPEWDWPLALERLKHRLGPDFDVVLEANHLHVEFDPD